MSKNVNALSTEDLEGISGGGYEFNRMVTFDGSKRLVFKKVGDPQTIEDNKRMGDKLRAEGVNVSVDSPLGRANRGAIEKWLRDAHDRGWEKAPDEIMILIYDDGRLGEMSPSLGDYDYSDYDYSGDGYA